MLHFNIYGQDKFHALTDDLSMKRDKTIEPGLQNFYSPDSRSVVISYFLNSLLSAGNLGKQFGPRSGPTNFQA